jgi:hypothetical protein
LPSESFIRPDVSVPSERKFFLLKKKY